MNGKKKILILGGSGFVGTHLFKRLESDQAIATYCKTPIEKGIPFDSLSMRLLDILKSPEEISHAVILLGYPSPETCAEDVTKSKALNVDSIKLIIQQLNELKIKPVFTSSEYVFDGKKGCYLEDDKVNPVLIYGKQKVEIENYIRSVCNDFIIIRLAKAFSSEQGDKGGDIFTNWVNAIKQHRTIRCAHDQIFSPIFIEDVVESIIRLIKNDANGIFNVSGEKPFSRIELLNLLVRNIKEFSSIEVKIISCSIHDFDLKEKRPLNVSLNPTKLINETGIKLTTVETICEKIAKNNFSKNWGIINTISDIDLSNPESVKVDDGPRSIAYFCKKQPVRVNFKLIGKFKGVMASTKKNVRLCLHPDSSSKFHTMVILERKGKYYRPHKHENKGELFQMIEGRMAVFIFDEEGEVIDSCILTPEENFLYKIGDDMYHAVMPLSEVVIYHESKLGPFKGDKDSIYPPWAPDGSNAKEVEEYSERLLNTLKLNKA